MRRTVLALLAFVVLASGCSLGPREDWIRDIRGGLAAAADEGTAKVTHNVAIKAIETNIREIPPPLFVKSKGVAVFGPKQARLVESAKRKAQVVYDDLAVYLTRSKSSIADSGKSWARFDYEAEPSSDIDTNDRRLAIGAALISPVVAMELLGGVLTGSLEQHETATKGGVETTRYTGRLSPDAAVIEITDEDRADGVLRMFDNLGVQQDDFPAEVWVDAEHRVRAIRFTLRQQKDRVNAFELTMDWEFAHYGTKADVPIPASAKTLRSTRYRDFIEEIIREFV
jgi:hypothetical protein